MHVKFVVFGWSNEDQGEIVRGGEGALDFYRANTPLNITAEWYWSSKTLPPNIFPDLGFDKMGELWNELSPQSILTVAIWRCTATSQYTGWGWTDVPDVTPQNHQTILIRLPYGYPPDPRDGRTSWDPAYGEGFTNNFQACLVHEMAHAIRNLGLMTSPPVYDAIVDIHDTNNKLSAVNPSANGVEKARNFLSQFGVNAHVYNLINAIPNYVVFSFKTALITQVTPADTIITVNGEVLKNGAPNSVVVGTHTWEARRDGYITQSGSITLTRSAVSFLKVNLQPAA
jgi:hypothetical protein